MVTSYEGPAFGDVFGDVQNTRFVIGKPKLDFARLGVEEYVARLRPYVPVELHFLKATAQAGESLALLERSKSMFRVVLDEKGEEVTSRGLAQKLGEWERHGPRD